MSLRLSAGAMTAFMKKIEVIANNISNSQTVGFKKMDLDFTDLVVKYSKVPAINDSPTGKSDGQGMKVKSSDIKQNQGSFKTTGNPLDWAISGPGFFKVQDPITGESLYTRNGSFKVNEQGRIVSSSGYALEPAIQLQPAQQLSHISDDGRVWIRESGSSILSNIAQVNITNFTNPSGLMAAGVSMYRPTLASGAEIQGPPKQNGMGSINSGVLETSNVNLVREMVDLINTQKAYDTNHKVILAEDKMAGLGDIVARR